MWKLWSLACGAEPLAYKWLLQHLSDTEDGCFILLSVNGQNDRSVCLSRLILLATPAAVGMHCSEDNNIGLFIK